MCPSTRASAARGSRSIAQLPRTRIEHDIPETQKTCACGCQLSRIGEVTSEQIGMVPARGFVKQHVRFKYACRSCEGADHDGPAVITAPMPAQPLPKSNCSPELAAFITVSKYADGLPLYRLEGILARYRISVSRTAMACWMIKLGDLVQPLIDLFNDHMLAYDVLQMDETTVQVLKEEGRAAKDKSYMWVRRGGQPGQPVILFDYAATRAASVPLELLSDYQGYLQSDDYAGYNAAAKRDGVKHVGCLDHARRYFIKAVQAQHGVAGSERGLAPDALKIIRKLYAVEKLARDAKMTAEQRHNSATRKSEADLGRTARVARQEPRRGTAANVHGQGDQLSRSRLAAPHPLSRRRPRRDLERAVRERDPSVRHRKKELALLGHAGGRARIGETLRHHRDGEGDAASSPTPTCA